MTFTGFTFGKHRQQQHHGSNPSDTTQREPISPCPKRSGRRSSAKTGAENCSVETGLQPPVSVSSPHCTSTDVSHLSSSGTGTSELNTIVTLEVITAFFEDLGFTDIANAIRKKTSPPLPHDEFATRRLVEALLIQQEKASISRGTKLKLTDPSNKSSSDTAQKPAAPMLQHILEPDQPLPRHKMGELTEQLAVGFPPFSSPSCKEGKSTYPRYKAPLGRQAGRLDLCGSSSTLSESIKIKNVKSPTLHRDLSGDIDDLSSLNPTPSSYGPWVGLSLANLPRSESYCPKRQGSDEDDFFDPSDQYRDDDDPGYRIRDLWECELIEEIQARNRNDPGVGRYPYYAAFVPTSSRSQNSHNRQYASNGRSHSIRSTAPLQYQSTVATISNMTITSGVPSEAIDLSVSSSRQIKETDFSQFSSSSGHISQYPNTPYRQRKSSLSSHSSSYILNSTPPPRNSFQKQNNHSGNSLHNMNIEGQSSVVTGSPSLQFDYYNKSTQRCNSPSFGSPQLSGPIDGDDELSGSVTSNILGHLSFAMMNSHSNIENQNTQLLSVPQGSEDIKVFNEGHPQTSSSIVSSPKSPMFGIDNIDSFQNVGSMEKRDEDDKDYCSSSELQKEKESYQSSDLQDELACCSSASGTKPSPKARLGDFPLPPSPTSVPPDIEDQDTYFGEDPKEREYARRWRETYSDGNLEVYRKEKLREKVSKSRGVLYPKSGDSEYPMIDDDNITIDCFNLKVIYERNKTGFEESKEFPAQIGSVVAGRYVIEGQLGQAAFSKALKCFDRKLKQYVCMKVIRNDKDYVDQSLDEIKLLRYINYNGDVDRFHCLKLYEFFYYREHLIIVTEMLKENLYEFSRYHRGQGLSYFTIGRVQRVAAQVLIALQYVHSLRLIHSDLKPENILIKNPENCEIKVIDFGSSCFEDDVLSLYVQSRSYRAPEVILGLPYDQKIDIWSLGCILVELWTGYVLFQNDSISALLARIVGVVGQLPYYMVKKGKMVSEHFTQDGQLFKVKTNEPTSTKNGKRIRILLPKPSSLKQRLRTHDLVFVDFLTQLLQIDPARRPTATDALQHPWLQPGRYSDGL